MATEHDFSEAMGLASNGKKDDYEVIDAVLASSSPQRHSSYSKSCAKTCKTKLGECAKMILSCTKRKVDLPEIPESFDLIGARVTEINVKGRHLDLPHLVLHSKKQRLSIYLFCATMAEKLMNEHSSKILEGVHGCAECGILARRRGEFLMLLVSDMPPSQLAAIAEEL